MKATQSTDETWLPVVGFEGYYEVSDLGRVRGIRRKGSRGGIMKTPLSAGYPSVSLHGDVVRKERVHVMVAAAFIGPRPPGMHICHENDVRTDNRPANLRYDTQLENNRDIVRHGRHWEAVKTECKYGHPFTPENTYICTNGSRSCRTCANASSNRHYHAKGKARRAAP